MAGRCRSLGGSGVYRVNPGPGVDAPEGADGDSKGDARTYPEGSCGRRGTALLRSPPTTKVASHARLRPSDPLRSRRGVQDGGAGGGTVRRVRRHARVA
ncbi:hypothetical protein C4B68_24285 [Streptomyces dengpaensis]|uniref:Uncharacterized protein n=1 Tax=Streptomyces dengpaensis TaxID=2049881 RepID=A0ABM6SUR3_9ACTN|nr:hypothetical protein C4B68_24285 [Streptomyces dengpaensis]